VHPTRPDGMLVYPHMQVSFPVMQQSMRTLVSDSTLVHHWRQLLPLPVKECWGSGFDTISPAQSWLCVLVIVLPMAWACRVYGFLLIWSSGYHHETLFKSPGIHPEFDRYSLIPQEFTMNLWWSLTRVHINSWYLFKILGAETPSCMVMCLQQGHLGTVWVQRDLNRRHSGYEFGIPPLIHG
jgi:hypothetical protein